MSDLFDDCPDGAYEMNINTSCSNGKEAKMDEKNDSGIERIASKRGEKTYDGGKTYGRMHVLKTEFSIWCDIFEGRKTFEYRKNDRNYEVGDTLLLMAYYPETDTTGGEIHVDVTYLLKGGQFGIPDDYCIMQFKIISK